LSLLGACVFFLLIRVVQGPGKGVGWGILIVLLAGVWTFAGIYLFVVPVAQLFGWPA
jgi:hypothetical protein